MLAKAVITSILLTLAFSTATGSLAATPAERQRDATVSLYTVNKGEWMAICAGVFVGKNTVMTNKHCLEAAKKTKKKIYYNYTHCDTDKEIAFDGTDNVLVRTCLTSKVFYKLYKLPPKLGDKVTHYGHPFGMPLAWRSGEYVLKMHNEHPAVPMGWVYLFDMNTAGGDSGGPIWDSKGRLICTLAFRAEMFGDPFALAGCYLPMFTAKQLKEIR